MKKYKLLKWIGYGLILCSLLSVLTGWICGRIAQKNRQQVLRQMEQILPPRTEGVPDQYTVMEMPLLQLAGRDYLALLEVPGYGIRLPVTGTWKPGSLFLGPQRFSGTVYDGSLVIGGRDESGQFDFLWQIQLGDSIIVTDMTGAEFVYYVSQIDRTDEAPTQALLEREAELTLFARGSYSTDYIIVRCVSTWLPGS